MGFNATRRYRDSKRRDVGLLMFGVVALLALMAWAAGLI
jgi:predicted nucleic acid-binding Zn ribbon protein